MSDIPSDARSTGPVPSNLGTITTAGPRLLLELLSRTGVDSRRLARETGFDVDQLADPAARVAARLGMDLLNRAATEVNDPLFGAHFGIEHQPGRMGLFDYLFLTANTLEDAFDTAIRHISVAATGGAYQWAGPYQWAEPGGRTVVERVLPGGPGYRQAESYVLSWQLTMARHATSAPST